MSFWNWKFLAVLAIYLVLAFTGIRYGLPDESHILSYNCDETTWVDALRYLTPERRFNPHPHLAQPTFYLETYAFGVFFAHKMGLVPLHQSKEFYRLHPEAFARIYLIGRYLQILFGAILLLAFYRFTYLIFGERAAFLGTSLLAVTPSFIAASHFSQANVPVTALSFLALGFLLLDVKQEDDRWFLTASFFSGLALSTKYSAGPLVLLLAYQMIHRGFRWSVCLRSAIFLGAGFVLGSPFSLLAPRSFLAALQIMTADAQRPISNFAEKLSFPFRVSFHYALGVALLVASVMAAVWALWTRDRFKTTLLLWLGAFLAGVFVAGHAASPGRVMIAVPAAIWLVTLMIERGIERGHKWAFISILGYAGVWIFTLLPSLAVVALFVRTPIQKSASQWIDNNLPREARIGLPREIFYWTPDVIYTSVHKSERMLNPFRRVEILNYTIEKAREMDYLIVTGREKQDLLLRGGKEVAFMKWLDSGQDFILLKEFPRDVHIGPFHWKRPEEPEVVDDDLWATSLFIYQRRPSLTQRPSA